VRKFLDQIALLLSIVSSIDALGAKAVDSCQSCHVEKNDIATAFDRHHIGTTGADLQCYACHIDLIRDTPIKGFPQFLRNSLGQIMRKKQTYAQAKAIEFKQSIDGQRTLLKYNEEGFFRYIKSPIPRYGFKSDSSMFPVGTALEKKLRLELSGALQQSPLPVQDPDKMRRGEDLFEKKCVSCHAGHGPGPSLRIGIPLLSESYIIAALQGAISHLSPQMPKFAELPDTDRVALAHYLQFADTDKKFSQRSDEAFTLLLPQELYPKMIIPLLGGSCRHCHADNADNQEIFQNLFGYERPIGFLLQRTKRGYEPTAEGMNKLLPKDKSCEPSEFLQRLTVRKNESQGEYNPDKPGMPLTMPYVSTSVVESIKSWQRTGCYVDGKKLCHSCDNIVLRNGLLP
jgi:mono/diheme cytochrome c family protein